MVRLGEPMLDLMPPAGAIEGVTAQACRGSVPVLRQIGELDAVVGQHSVDIVGHCIDQFVYGSGPNNGLSLRAIWCFTAE